MLTRFSRGFAAILLVTMLALAIAPTAAQGGPPQVGLHPFAEGYALHGPYWVGTREFVIDPGSERPIPLQVWYPALNPEGATEETSYETPVKWMPGPDFPTVYFGHALPDAATDTSDGPYPVVVFSPGFGTNHVFYSNLTEHIASHGFVVLGVDHRETVNLAEENIFKDTPVLMIERPRDIRRTLDYAETLTATGGALAGLLDLEHIAVAGHSFGGYTALATGNARFDLTAFNARCAASRAEGDPNAWLCDPIEPFETEMATAAGLNSMPEGLWPAQGDPRVDAIISMAGDSYLFDRAGLAEITIPLLAMGGTADTSTPVDWGILPAFEYTSSQQKVLVLFENAEHGIFANNCAAAPWLVDIGFVWFCADPIWDRLRTNDLANHFMTAFLLTTLKGDADAAAALAPDAVALPGISYQAQGF